MESSSGEERDIKAIASGSGTHRDDELRDFTPPTFYSSKAIATIPCQISSQVLREVDRSGFRAMRMLMVQEVRDGYSGLSYTGYE